MILPVTPFNFERRMLAPLAEGLPHLLGYGGDRTVRILREPTMGLIIPDLLVGAWRADRAPRAHPATTWVDAHVRALIEREGVVATGDLRKRLHLSPNAASLSAMRLYRSGQIAPAPEGPISFTNPASPAVADSVRWTLTPGAETTRLEIVAVEAKLSRWQDAVVQAANYLTFADRAYVVLDGNRVDATPALLDAAGAARVGLVLQHGRVLRHIAVAPVQPAPLTPTRVLAVTKLATERGGRAFRASKGRVGAHVPGADDCTASDAQ
jgi:hypothetical protein